MVVSAGRVAEVGGEDGGEGGRGDGTPSRTTSGERREEEGG